MADLLRQITTLISDPVYAIGAVLLACAVLGMALRQSRSRGMGRGAAKKPAEAAMPGLGGSTRRTGQAIGSGLAVRSGETIEIDKPVRTHEPSSHIERLFGILEAGAQSAERASAAHVAAARHLDSAEYQLLRLFDEFPMLSASRQRASRLAPTVAPQRPMPVRVLAA